MESDKNVGAAPELQRKSRKPQGFAALPPERVRQIASMGGKAAHAQGKAHEWTPEEAREAGKKGGMTPRSSR